MTSDLGPRTSDRDAHDRDARARLCRCFWAVARRHQLSEATLSEIVSTELGERVVVGSGFGLSRLSKIQWIRAVDALKRYVGQEPGQHWRGAWFTRRARWVRRAETAAGVVRLASPEQRDLVVAKAIEVFGPDLGSGSQFATWLYRMSRRTEIRQLTYTQADKVIEGLTAMGARGWRPSHAEPQSRGGEPGDVA